MKLVTLTELSVRFQFHLCTRWERSSGGVMDRVFRMQHRASSCHAVTLVNTLLLSGTED